jgi:hypothetical protein
MSLKKALAIAAAVGAVAAISVPALAFDNEIHGTSRLRYFLSNYENGGGGNPLQVTSATGKIALPFANTTENLKMNNYFEQRSRLFYTAKASDDLKLVTAFEIDSVFGDKAQSATTGANVPPGTGRNQGGALESDTVNLETKWVYLDFLIPSTTTRVTAGIQPFKDQLKGIFLDADIAGVLATTQAGPASLKAGYLRAYDQSFFAVSTATTRPRGMDNLEIGVVEAKFALTKDSSLGAVYYLYNDNRGNNINGQAGTLTSPNITTNDIMIHTLGLTGDFKVGDLSLSGFGAYQGGVFKGITPRGDSAYLNAVAANVALKLPVGPGTFRTAMLFTSGNDFNASTGKSGHLTGWVGTTQAQNNGWTTSAGTSTYNESGMMLLNRNAAAGTGTTDVAIVYNPGNGDSIATMQGLYLASVGYDAKITPKLYANGNVGAAWAAHTNSLKPVNGLSGRNQTNYMGTEVNLEAGYKMYDNLTFSLQAAYVLLGGYYENSVTVAGVPHDPENPYTVRSSLIFNF